MKQSITIALAGNPNSGKTTVFNSITGAHQHVGNWPGVTVEKKEGKCKYKDIEMKVVDLPGTYSLTTYTLEEVVARDFIVKDKPDIVVDIVDASNLERNLYLTTQLMELGANLVIALNMVDVAKSRGMVIDAQRLSRLLNVPVVPMIATKEKGTQELLETIVKTLQEGSPEDRKVKVNYGRELGDEIAKIENIIESIEDNPITRKYPTRWVALKILENDEKIVNAFNKSSEGKQAVKAAQTSMEHIDRIFKDDAESVIIDRRYGFISGVGHEVIHRTGEDRHTWSDRVDQVLLNRLVGIPIFLFLMWLTFQLTFKIGAYPMEWIDFAIGWLSEILRENLPRTWYRSLLVDGIIGGVGGVAVFLPNIFTLFFVISILEDSGYMARAAFITDRIMHIFGLHGKSFIPMLMGFGCNVPAILATRTLENKKDRIITILITPLMSCSARLPVYALLTAAFFPNHAGTVIFSLYFMGIVIAVLVGKLFGHIFFKGPTAPFVLELPPYRVPTLKGTLVHMWERGSLFIKKMGTIILVGSIVIWFMGTFPWGVEYASEDSYAGMLGQVIEPVVKPFGSDWRGGVALVFGFVAKEIVVGTFGVLYGTGEDTQALSTRLQSAMTPLSAYAFMVVTLIYVPCIATIAAVKKETASWKWTSLSVSYSLALAWLLATMIFQIGSLLGLS
ncbi:ferrous iron transport protein B [Candidatus Poribacteria bacterium]|nr:ferrous iron transport protein B [Candidatus Poribacteria bacterium]